MSGSAFDPYETGIDAELRRVLPVATDIDRLLVGVPVHAEAGHGGGVWLDERYRVSLTGLKEAEVRALFISTRSIPLQDLGLEQAAAGTLLKLFAALPALHRREAERMQQRIHLDPAWWWHKGDTLPHLETLKAAVFEDVCVKVQYERGDGSLSERILEPYSLVAKASVWYLIARREGELRTYRVSRFVSVERLGRSFTRDETFNLAEYWQAHTADFVAALPDFWVTLRIPADRLQFLNWYAANRYTIRAARSDEAELVVDLRLSSLEEARMLVLGLGAEADIIEPDTLREAVLLQAQQVAARWASE